MKCLLIGLRKKQLLRSDYEDQSIELEYFEVLCTDLDELFGSAIIAKEIDNLYKLDTYSVVRKFVRSMVFDCRNR